MRPWPGPGLASQKLPIAAPGFSAQRRAPRAKDESQGGSAGTCSSHSLSPGAALHGTGLEARQHKREGQPCSWPQPCATLMAFHRLGSVSWAPPTGLGPLLHFQVSVLVTCPAAIGKCPFGPQRSQFFSPHPCLFWKSWAYLVYLAIAAFFLMCHHL